MSTSAPRRRVTIYDLARAAGVSHTTVSRYLRFDGKGLKTATRERIRAAIDELGYRPNLAARAMRTTRTGLVAILLPAGSAVSALRMLTGATAAAHAAGRQVEVVTLDGPPTVRTARLLQLADSGLFEGVLALTPLLPGNVEEVETSTPIVVSADYDEEMRAIGELADGSPVAEIMAHLADQGHRRFLHIAGDRDYATARSREQVYQQSVERLGVESAGVVGGDWLPETARRAVLDLPDGCGVTAVIAANDILAAASARGAVERGWRVPDDLSVTGWDNNPLGAWLSPTLTTVEVNYEELGRRAMDRLDAVLRDETPPRHDDSVSTVVWRDSTGPARAASAGRE